MYRKWLYVLDNKSVWYLSLWRSSPIEGLAQRIRMIFYSFILQIYGVSAICQAGCWPYGWEPHRQVPALKECLFQTAQRFHLTGQIQVVLVTCHIILREFWAASGLRRKRCYWLICEGCCYRVSKCMLHIGFQWFRFLKMVMRVYNKAETSWSEHRF